MGEMKKVALLIETSTSYGRALVKGILQYANFATSWIFYNEPRGLWDTLPELSKQNVDGIIMRDTPKNMLLLKLGIPTIVSIRYKRSIKNVPSILSDSNEIGIMAAKYLQDKGFNHFAFSGFDNMPWSKEREKAFVDTVSPTGDIAVYRNKQKLSDYKELLYLANWLTSLPKPTGLVACNDVRGANVIEACKLAGIKIPQEISILGVNNDDMICEMTHPSLSSISLNIKKGGYEAAKMLDRLMKGELGQKKDIIIKPRNVVSRMSTSIMATTDPDIANALHYIAQNNKKHIQVNDVAINVGINRRSLERRFKQVMNRSIYDEIKRVRIDTIAKMLAATDIQISEIAYKMGFNDTHHISRYFKSVKGVSPLNYRKEHQI